VRPQNSRSASSTISLRAGLRSMPDS
jgi:hypothetical protein